MSSRQWRRAGPGHETHQIARPCRGTLLLLLLRQMVLPPALLVMLLGRALSLALTVAGPVRSRQAGAVGGPAELPRRLQRLDFIARQEAPARATHPTRCMVVPGLMQVGLRHRHPPNS